MSQFTGRGYCVGPHLQLEGDMVLNFFDKGEMLNLCIHEARPYELDQDRRRRENAVSLRIDQVRGLLDELAVVSHDVVH